jgi:large subunit ribosomal protein L30
MGNRIKVTLIRSKIGKPAKHRKTLTALGLRKLHQSKIFDNSPAIMGMVNQINHLLKIEVCTDETT